MLWGPFTATDLCEAQAYKTDNVKAFTMTKLLKELIRMLNDKKDGAMVKNRVGNYIALSLLPLFQKEQREQIVLVALYLEATRAIRSCRSLQKEQRE